MSQIQIVYASWIQESLYAGYITTFFGAPKVPAELAADEAVAHFTHDEDQDGGNKDDPAGRQQDKRNLVQNSRRQQKMENKEH